jgi:succinyl-CoA synthetase beta subunit
MANSARLAKATMDITWLDGMFPASFIDVGGRSVAHDTIADGEIAANAVNTAVPLVVPLQGTTVDQGDAILNDLGLAVVPAHRPCDAGRRWLSRCNGWPDAYRCSRRAIDGTHRVRPTQTSSRQIRRRT